MSLPAGPQICKGYLQPELQAKGVVDEEGFWHTGDLVEVMEGNALRFLGRTVIKLSTGNSRCDLACLVLTCHLVTGHLVWPQQACAHRPWPS